MCTLHESIRTEISHLYHQPHPTDHQFLHRCLHAQSQTAARDVVSHCFFPEVSLWTSLNSTDSASSLQRGSESPIFLLALPYSLNSTKQCLSGSLSTLPAFVNSEKQPTSLEAPTLWVWLSEGKDAALTFTGVRIWQPSKAMSLWFAQNVYSTGNSVWETLG